MTWKSIADWRLALTIVVAVMVGYLIFAGYSTAQESEAKGDRVDELISQANEREDDLREERHEAEANRQALLDYTKALAERQRALLAWLQRTGISIPPRFLEQIDPPDSVTDSGSSYGPRTVIPTLSEKEYRDGDQPERMERPSLPQ